jgi:hypothetical protein
MCISIQDEPGRRDKSLVAALAHLPSYPSRNAPADPLPPSFVALNEVLAVAPEMWDHEFAGKNLENIRVDDIPAEQDTMYFWSQEYFTRVYQALIDVIEAHGTGPEGWAAARWLVYDKVRLGSLSWYCLIERIRG